MGAPSTPQGKAAVDSLSSAPDESLCFAARFGIDRDVRVRGALGWLIATALSLSTAAAFAEPLPVVAVFLIESKDAPVSVRDLEKLTDYLATRLTESQRFEVVPRAQLRAVLRRQKRESYKKCYDESCQIEIGKEVAAAKSLASSVTGFGPKCIIALRLFDLKKSTQEAAATATGNCSVNGILLSLEAALAKLTGVPAASPPPPAPAPPPPPPPTKEVPAKAPPPPSRVPKPRGAVPEPRRTVPKPPAPPAPARPPDPPVAPYDKGEGWQLLYTCPKWITGPMLLGWCSDGELYALVHAGSLVFAGADDEAYGLLGVSLVSWIEDDSFMFLRLGLYNGSGDDTGGIQVGGFNQVDGAFVGLQFGLANRVDDDFVGLLQFGLLNFNDEDANGLLVGVLYNYVDNDMSGIQVGAVNLVDDEATGAQFGLVNYVHWDASLLQVGAANLSDEDLIGVQLGGFNYVEDDVVGAQLGAVNYCEDRIEGLQLGGINIAYDDIEGVQVGAINLVNDDIGMQFGGFNYAGGDALLQVGAANWSDDDQSLQLGILNVADDVNGIQAGLINIAMDRLDGVQLGALNIGDGFAPVFPGINFDP